MAVSETVDILNDLGTDLGIELGANLKRRYEERRLPDLISLLSFLDSPSNPVAETKFEYLDSAEIRCFGTKMYKRLDFAL